MHCGKFGVVAEFDLSGVQLIEQSVGLLQIERVETLGEPAIHRSEKIAGLIPLALIALEPRHTVPISNSLHLDQLGGAGVGAATVLSVLMLVLISFAAGIVARTAAGRRITRWSENSLLGRFPQYQLIKSVAEGLGVGSGAALRGVDLGLPIADH